MGDYHTLHHGSGAQQLEMYRRSAEMSGPAEDDRRRTVVSTLACVMEQLFSNPADKLPAEPEKLSLFHTEQVPAVSIGYYFQRLAKYTEVSTECLMLSMVHINRIIATQPEVEVNSLNIHRLLLTSIMCTAKFYDDCYYNNKFYSRIGGVPLSELNTLEVEFLALLNFDLFVPEAVYVDFYLQVSNPDFHSRCDCHYSKLPPIVLAPSPVHHEPPSDVVHRTIHGDPEVPAIQTGLVPVPGSVVPTHLAQQVVVGMPVTVPVQRVARGASRPVMHVVPHRPSQFASGHLLHAPVPRRGPSSDPLPYESSSFAQSVFETAYIPPATTKRHPQQVKPVYSHPSHTSWAHPQPTLPHQVADPSRCMHQSVVYRNSAAAELERSFDPSVFEYKEPRMAMPLPGSGRIVQAPMTAATSAPGGPWAPFGYYPPVPEAPTGVVVCGSAHPLPALQKGSYMSNR